VFSLDEAMLFAPTDLDVSITPQTISAAVGRQEYGLAVNMALHLGEKNVLKKALDAVPAMGIELVVKSLDVRMLRDVLRFLAEELVQSRHVEYYLRWVWAILRSYGTVLQADSMPFLESIRALIRAVGSHEKEILKMSDENLFSLEFLSSQMTEAALNHPDAHLDSGDNNSVWRTGKTSSNANAKIAVIEDGDVDEDDNQDQDDEDDEDEELVAEYDSDLDSEPEPVEDSDDEEEEVAPHRRKGKGSNKSEKKSTKKVDSKALKGNKKDGNVAESGKKKKKSRGN
jgi:Dip2/Utp12 Family